jgi:shikimate kinase
VLATGGGAFMDEGSRALIKSKGVSVWLKADLDVLMKRVEKRDSRPLLRAPNPRAVMAGLMEKRYPVYAEADITVESGHGPHDNAVDAVLRALAARFAPSPKP